MKPLLRFLCGKGSKPNSRHNSSLASYDSGYLLYSLIINTWPIRRVFISNCVKHCYVMRSQLKYLQMQTLSLVEQQVMIAQKQALL